MERLRARVPGPLLERIERSKEAEIESTAAALAAFLDRDPVFRHALDRLLQPTTCGKDYESAAKHKADGNRAFQQRDYKQAIQDYTKALKLMPWNSASCNDLATIFSNRATSFHKSGLKLEGIRDCDRAIALNESYAKAWYRRGLIKADLCDYQGAVLDMKLLILASVRTSLKAGISAQTAMYWSADKQWGLRTTSEVQAGTLVHSEEALAGILLKKHRPTHCHGCFGVVPADSVPCIGCGVVSYCNDACRDDATVEHKLECGGSGWAAALPEEGVLAARILVTNLQCEVDLCHHYNDLPSQTKVELYLLAATLAKCLMASWLAFSFEDLLAKLVLLLAMLRFNAMGIIHIYSSDETGSSSGAHICGIEHVVVAQALFVRGSKFNHSCSPNVHVSYVKRTLRAHCTEALPAFCPLEISYGVQDINKDSPQFILPAKRCLTCKAVRSLKDDGRRNLEDLQICGSRLNGNEAIADGLRLLENGRKCFHPFSKQLAQMEDIVARLYCEAGQQPAAAIVHARRSIEILERIYGKDHIAMAYERLKLASIAGITGAARECLAMAERTFSFYYGFDYGAVFPDLKRVMVPEELLAEIFSRVDKGTRQGLQEVFEWNHVLQKMVGLPYEILGIKAVPCPIVGGNQVNWEVMCCSEGFVIMYSREIGQSHLFDLSKGSSIQITRDLCATTFSSNPQMVYLRGSLYIAADGKTLGRYDLDVKEWSVLAELPTDCKLERMLVFQDGIVGAFERVTFPVGIKAVSLELRFLDMGSHSICTKGWCEPFTVTVIESGVIPAMTVLNKDSGGNWLYFWNEETSAWECLSGKLDGEPIKQLVVMKDNELHAYSSHGTLVSKCLIHWDAENVQFSKVKWERVFGSTYNKPIKFLSNIPYKLGNMTFSLEVSIPVSKHSHHVSKRLIEVFKMGVRILAFVLAFEVLTDERRRYALRDAIPKSMGDQGDWAQDGGPSSSGTLERGDRADAPMGRGSGTLERGGRADAPMGRGSGTLERGSIIQNYEQKNDAPEELLGLPCLSILRVCPPSLAGYMCRVMFHHFKRAVAVDL
ncbi:hypothetical protein SELMODRAFT_415607 [Selaginella moellendorffii]|uniref:MYND-type domain-containing protein n=1 Tax=Selaginella moellendorffii TaxID=88036 RepID=D8RWN8_SELML|nr:hypothetical protein SELMODRAFT_415607 [Selaginella moellendorffii]